MENASKALIIAGSVLLAVMIVSFGVTIFNRARGSSDTSAIGSEEVTMFNQKFERYSGEQKGSQIKSLISYLIANASTNKDEDLKIPKVLINSTFSSDTTITGDTVYTKAASDGIVAGSSVQTYINYLGKVRTWVVSTSQYKVTCTYAENGLINEIKIEKQ